MINKEKRGFSGSHHMYEANNYLINKDYETAKRCFELAKIELEAERKELLNRGNFDEAEHKKLELEYVKSSLEKLPKEISQDNPLPKFKYYQAPILSISFVLILLSFILSTATITGNIIGQSPNAPYFSAGLFILGILGIWISKR